MSTSNDDASCHYEWKHCEFNRIYLMYAACTMHIAHRPPHSNHILNSRLFASNGIATTKCIVHSTAIRITSRISNANDRFPYNRIPICLCNFRIGFNNCRTVVVIVKCFNNKSNLYGAWPVGCYCIMKYIFCNIQCELLWFPFSIWLNLINKWIF